MKKKFLPAELREWGDRWMIIFHQVNPSNGKRKRFARSFELNRINSIPEKRKRADKIVKELNSSLLPQGYPFVTPASLEKKQFDTNVVEALQFALSCKSVISKSSATAYKYVYGKFISYLKKNKMDSLSISDITPKISLAYLDSLIVDQKLSNLTHNNIASKTKSLFTILESREYIMKGTNPFENFKNLVPEEKERRPLMPKEKQILADYIKEKEPYLYVAVNILYYCFVRKAEMLRLKFRMVDLDKAVIRIPGKGSKNKKSQIVTMPKQLVELLREFKFDKYPSNWICFGKKFKPHHSTPCGINTPTSKHRRLVNQLAKEGKLKDVKGIHFYGWKDTGVLNMIEKGIDIRKIQNQLRHSSLEETQKYLKQIYDVIPEIRSMESDI